MNARHILAAAVIGAFALGASPAYAQNQKQDQKPNQKQSQKKDQKQSQNAPAIVLVPVAIALQSDFSEGCWARLYSDDHFEGDRLQLVGPTDMPNMRTAFGRDWSGEFESLEVGPKATLTVYDNENYAQRVATFKPGQRVAELDDRMGWFEQIRSVKIACSGGAQTAQGGAPKNDASAGASAQKK